MPQEQRVYVVNSTHNKINVPDALWRGDFEEVMAEAEQQGTVYSLAGFQDECNKDMPTLDLNQCWIYITPAPTKTVEDCIEFAMGQLCSDTETNYTDSFLRLQKYEHADCTYIKHKEAKVKYQHFSDYAGITVYEPFESYDYESFIKEVENMVEGTVRFAGLTNEEYTKWLQEHTIS